MRCQRSKISGQRLAEPSFSHGRSAAPQRDCKTVRLRLAKSCGFTIIELVSVLAIIVVLLSIALGSYSGWMRTSGIDAAANLTVAALDHARELAITQQTDIQLICSNLTLTGRAPCGTVAVYTHLSDTNAADLLAMPPITLPPGFGFPATSEQSATFHPDGTCSANNPVDNSARFIVAETTLTGGRTLHPRVVDVNQLSGRIRVRREGEL